mmetsp:Transcript_23574/g.41720  ORF Transcript_23574/g.41720 Transcript_23574/m.41720 type:complete len:201 (-) Transcript_23574:190-792(-)
MYSPQTSFCSSGSSRFDMVAPLVSFFLPLGFGVLVSVSPRAQVLLSSCFTTSSEKSKLFLGLGLVGGTDLSAVGFCKTPPNMSASALSTFGPAPAEGVLIGVVKCGALIPGIKSSPSDLLVFRLGSAAADFQRRWAGGAAASSAAAPSPEMKSGIASGSPERKSGISSTTGFVFGFCLGDLEITIVGDVQPTGDLMPPPV